MAILRKRKTKKGFVYDLDFTYNGQRYIRSTKTSDAKVARQIWAEIEAKISRGTFRLEEAEPPKDIRLSVFFREYWEYAKTFKGERTINNEKHTAKIFTAFIGDKNLRSVSPRELDQWRSLELSRHSPTTYNIGRRFLHAAFNVAVKWEYLEANPVTKLAKAKVEEKRIYMTDEEVAKLFEVIDADIRDSTKVHILTYNRAYRLYVEFLLNTGLRRSEALNLTKEKVDLVHGCVYIEKSKSKKFRAVPLNRRAKEILTELGDECFAKLSILTVSQKFNSFMKRLKLTQFKLHSLRHTFATNLVSQGVDIYAVKELLGHADIRTSLIYAKARTELLQDAVDRLDKKE